MKELDHTVHLERVVHWLFPEIDPSLFLRAVILANITPDEKGSRVSEIISRRWAFGFMPTSFYWKPDEYPGAVKATLDLILSVEDLEKKLNDKSLLNHYKDLRSLNGHTMSNDGLRIRGMLLELVKLLSKYKNIKLTMRKPTARSKTV